MTNAIALRLRPRILLTVSLLGLLCNIAAGQDSGTYVRTIDTSALTPPSPDPAGITYNNLSGRLIFSDSEVNEMSIFAGVNLFDINIFGTLINIGSTTGFSDEPTGVAFNPFDGHLFISDDDDDTIYEIAPGSDGLYGTSDDSVTAFSTLGLDPPSTDPEDVAFDPVDNVLFIVDGGGSKIYRLEPGPNGIFDGIQPPGDDIATVTDTLSYGLSDPEGIAVGTGPLRGLYLVGKPADMVLNLTTSGNFIRTIDISSAAPVLPAGLAFAPGSNPSGDTSLYIVDRGIDNNDNPRENDGKIYEFVIPPILNIPPSVDAGGDQAILFPNAVQLSGTVSDDGQPSPPGAVSVQWSSRLGAGEAFISDPSAISTSANFSEAGSYLISLSADDGELQSSDDVHISTNPAGLASIIRQISNSTDDAEESDTGDILRANADLELVEDGARGNQTVGLRFTDINIPQGAVIASAFIQFQADETGSSSTLLNIRAQAADDSLSFTSATGSITARPTTIANVQWAPAPWASVGDAGLAQRTPDIAPIIQEVLDRPGWQAGNALVAIISGVGNRTAESYDGLPEAAPWLHIQYETAAAPANTAPTVSAGADQTITLPADASLSGSVSDDGLPNPPGTVTTLWTQVSGPASATIASPSTLATTVSFPLEGVYVLRLTASDGEFSSFDELTVTVNAVPVVSIITPENDAAFIVGELITFSASASDQEDGDLSNQISWFSHRSGFLGQGQSISVAISDQGRHKITAVVVDSDGAEGAMEIAIQLRK